MVASTLTLAPLVAQTPAAPRPATAAANVSVAEPPAAAAFALAMLEGVVHERDAAIAAGRGPCIARDPWDRLLLAGYQCQFVHATGETATVAVASSTGLGVPDRLDPQRWGVYAFPIEAAPRAQPTFFLAADGDVLWAVAGNGDDGYAGTQRPAPAAAFGKGGDGTWAARQRTAGTGEDGLLWQPASMLPRARADVVVTADGAPFAGAEVWLMPASGGPALARLPAGVPGVPLAGSWPAGIANAGANGTATLHGAAANDCVVRVALDGVWVEVAADAVQADGRTLRVAVARAAQSRHRRAAESVALATLRNVYSAQSQCQASGVIDVDGDGAGEFGFFGELSGGTAVRTDAAGTVGDTRIMPPVMAARFAAVRGSRVQFGGYRFQMFLRGAGGAWVGEHDGGGARGVAVDNERAEQH